MYLLFVYVKNYYNCSGLFCINQGDKEYISCIFIDFCWFFM